MKKRKTFFIYSGKGGVGKSTVTYNLAYALKKRGNKVGILDLDLKTPNMYRLFNSSKNITPPIIEKMKIKPAEIDGILVQSTGFINNNSGLFFTDDLAEGACFQLLHKSLYDVDYLLVDLPPNMDKIHSLACKNFKSSKFILISTYSLLSLEVGGTPFL
jgi:ATP-binding protein involved in chromosome partitioning